ncbi:MAG: class I SAM-dependent methyltransferase [Anaerolineales bacterium]
MTHDAQSLFAEFLHPQEDTNILILEGGDGWLAKLLAQFVPDGQVLSLARDIRDIRAAQTLLMETPNADASQDVFPHTTDWDIVLLTIPKERRYARTLLVSAWEALKPGGKLMLAGPSKSGAKAVIKDAERLFGNATTLGYRSHQRVATCFRGKNLVNPLPKEFQQPGIAPGTKHFIHVDKHESSFQLETHPGIFSWQELDEGTSLLLDHLTIEPGWRVWDVGCGYGVIGIYAALTGAAFVSMSDTNLIAIDYAQKNVRANHLDTRIETFAADTLSISQKSPDDQLCYDLIISNPAFHQGRPVDKSMADQLIAQATKYLTTRGRLLIVANRFLNYQKVMRAHFAHIVNVAETSKFQVIEACNH